MWRISSSLSYKCCYRNQKVTYCEVVRASINEIYRNGKKVVSAYIGPDTRIVYRSESSRMVWFIQMSEEMWQFEESGQIIFHKMINSLLPDVFKRWHDQKSHHVVTIVLFTSLDLSESKTPLGHGEIATNTRDYFRVVVDQVHISKWSKIMEKLRYEFFHFERDVRLQEDGKIRGRILPAVKGNLLQAISIASSLASSKFIDRDLRRTGVQTLIITPGAGIFDVDYDLMYQTSLKLLSIEIGVDLVCLSRAPLHVTPLLRYKTKDGLVKHCIPSWLDISFWSSTDRYTNQWIPRCKIYEIQMMGVMEDKVSSISIDYLTKGIFAPRSAEDVMTDYDNAIFKSQNELEAQRIVDEAIASAAPDLISRTRKANEILIEKSSMQVSRITARPVFSVSGQDNATNSDFKDNVTASLTLPAPHSAQTSLLSIAVKQSSSATTSPVLEPARNSDRSRWGFSKKSSTSSLRSLYLTDPKTIRKHISGGIFGTAREAASPNIPVVATQPDLPPETNTTLSTRQSSEGIHTPAVPILQFPKTPTSNFVSSSPSRPFAKRPSLTHRQSETSSLAFKRKENNPPKDASETAERHSMWMTIANPSNLPADKISNISNYGRWQFVYPKKVKRRAVKWRTLKSPAALPLLTPIFPSTKQFNEYRFQVYDATLYPGQSEYKTTDELLREMVAIRLSMGFQIVSKERVRNIEARSKSFGNPNGVVEVLPENAFNCRIYMSMGTQIHRLACDMQGTINIQMYANNDLQFLLFDRKYHPFVKTQYEDKYKPTTIDFFSSNPHQFNWNQIDQILTGNYDYVLEVQRMYCIRLVLVPVDVAQSLISPPLEAVPDKLNEEEIRLEGLKKLLVLLHRGKYYTREETKLISAKKMRPALLPETKFYTGNLGDFLLQLSDSRNGNGTEEQRGNSHSTKHHKDSLFIPSHLSSELLTRTIRLAKLAIEMQKGVKLVDRQWHRKTYDNCFTGSEFVTWLIGNFSDIESTEDAVEYGNHLMKQGLFQHADNRHTFLNGHYFYQLPAEYVLEFRGHENGSAGLHTNQKSKSSASLVNLASEPNNNTTLSEKSPNSPITSTPTKGKTSTNNTTKDTLNTSTQGHQQSAPLPKVLISRSLRYNADMAGRSKRPEVLTFHVDRVHNPKNCFHLRLEWLNTTPKLIDETIISIGRDTEQHGLKLVQVPMQEISQLPHSNPFVSLHRTRFVLDPFEFLKQYEADHKNNDNANGTDNNESVIEPVQSNNSTDTHTTPTSTTNDTSSSSTNNNTNDYANDTFSIMDMPALYFHKYMLKTLGYFTDIDPISAHVLQRIDVQYSWGKPTYNFPQYIHKSGLSLVQVLQDGEFVFMPNFLAASRIGLFTNKASHYQQQQQQQQQMPVTPESLRQELKNGCANKDELKVLFVKAKNAWESRRRPMI